MQKDLKEVNGQGKLQDTVDSISTVDVQLPQFTQRNLLQFEMVFMTEPQVNKCVQMFEGKVKSSNPIYLAWKALKTASLPSEEEALAMVLDSHTPKNILKRKARSGRKVPDGSARFNPIFDEWVEIMESTPIKKVKTAAPVKNIKKPGPSKKVKATEKLMTIKKPDIAEKQAATEKPLIERKTPVTGKAGAFKNTVETKKPTKKPAMKPAKQQVTKESTEKPAAPWLDGTRRH